jgi:protein-disulfide isomerase
MAVVALLAIVGIFIGTNYYRSSIEETRKPSAPNSALVRDDSPSMGPADAKVTIVEFLDPEWESCAAFAPAVKRVMKEFDGQVRLVIRYMPLHANSMRAAMLLEAAAEQGKFWPAFDMILERQPEWGEVHGAPPTAAKPDVGALFEKYARDLGLDVDKYLAAAKENRYAPKVDRDRKDGQSLNVRRTPTIFVNGRELTRLSENDLRSLVAEEMKK